jgi:hypothetical protein
MVGNPYNLARVFENVSAWAGISRNRMDGHNPLVVYGKPKNDGSNLRRILLSSRAHLLGSPPHFRHVRILESVVVWTRRTKSTRGNGNSCVNLLAVQHIEKLLASLAVATTGKRPQTLGPKLSQ